MVGHDVKRHLFKQRNMKVDDAIITDPHLFPCLGLLELLVVGDVGQGNATEDAKSFDKTLIIGGEYT